jgi:hypothetical protein
MFFDSRLFSRVHRFSAFRLCLPTFEKVLRVEKGSKLRFEF